MHPESISKALDRRRCTLCAEPVTGITCTRCGHLHNLAEHPDADAIIVFARRLAAASQWLAKNGHEYGGEFSGGGVPAGGKK